MIDAQSYRGADASRVWRSASRRMLLHAAQIGSSATVPVAAFGVSPNAFSRRRAGESIRFSRAPRKARHPLCGPGAPKCNEGGRAPNLLAAVGHPLRKSSRFCISVAKIVRKIGKVMQGNASLFTPPRGGTPSNRPFSPPAPHHKPLPLCHLLHSKSKIHHSKLFNFTPKNISFMNDFPPRPFFNQSQRQHPQKSAKKHDFRALLVPLNSQLHHLSTLQRPCPP